MSLAKISAVSFTINNASKQISAGFVTLSAAREFGGSGKFSAQKFSDKKAVKVRGHRIAHVALSVFI